MRIGRSKLRHHVKGMIDNLVGLKLRSILSVYLGSHLAVSQSTFGTPMSSSAASPGPSSRARSASCRSARARPGTEKDVEEFQ